jgi:hypothetical protein
MFARPVAKPKAKTVAPSKNTSPLHRATPFGHRHNDGGEYLHMLQQSIGNQAMLRLLRRQGLLENKHGDPGQDISPESVNAEGGSRGLAWDFSKIPPFPPKRMSGEFQSPSQFPALRLPGPIQAKLKVGAVNDPLEHEADRVADQVMRMPGPDVSFGTEPPQISRKCDACEEEEKLQMKEAGPQSAVGEAPGGVHEALSSPGQPLDAATRAYFEPRFGHDFSQVRVHADAQAAASARLVGARAYTVGRHIVFGDKQSGANRPLLAHELTHVVQQSRGSPRSSPPPDSRAPSTAAPHVELTTAVPLVARQPTPMYPPHASGHGGEQAMGFNQYRWEDGWACVRGPGGSGGHGVTAAGEDGLFYNVRTGILRIVDNKAFAGARNVGTATAIDPTENLLQNLDDMISAVEGIGSSADVPIRQDVLRLLRQTRAAVRNGNPIPGRVQLVVHNEWGRSADVTARLKRLGIGLVDSRTPVVPPAGADRPTLGLRTAPEVTPGSPPPAGGDVAETSFAGVLSETAAPKSPAATEIASGAGDVGSAALVAQASRLGAVARVAAALAIETLVFALIGLGLAYLEERSNRELIKRREHEGEARVQSALSESIDVIEAIQNSVQRPTVWVNTVFRVDLWETTYSGGASRRSTRSSTTQLWWASRSQRATSPTRDGRPRSRGTPPKRGSRGRQGSLTTTTRSPRRFHTTPIRWMRQVVPAAWSRTSATRCGRTCHPMSCRRSTTSTRRFCAR